MEQIWSGALEILEGDDRQRKQLLPRDLDNDEYHGKLHIAAVLSKDLRDGDEEGFLRVARPFLLVFTHTSLLGCLTVDTFVGALYNFISGTNGTRAVSFFLRICRALLASLVDTNL
jgi:hypothetical protein